MFCFSLIPDTEQFLNRANPEAEAAPGLVAEIDETSSLVSRNSSTDSGDAVEEGTDVNNDHSHHLDIRGLNMIPMAEFWFLFSLMGFLTGIGLMTIK